MEKQERKLAATGKLGPWARPRPLVWMLELLQYGATYITPRSDSGRPVMVEVTDG